MLKRSSINEQDFEEDPVLGSIAALLAEEDTGAALASRRRLRPDTGYPLVRKIKRGDHPPSGFGNDVISASGAQSARLVKKAGKERNLGGSKMVASKNYAPAPDSLSICDHLNVEHGSDHLWKEGNDRASHTAGEAQHTSPTRNDQNDSNILQEGSHDITECTEEEEVAEVSDTEAALESAKLRIMLHSLHFEGA